MKKYFGCLVLLIVLLLLPTASVSAQGGDGERRVFFSEAPLKFNEPAGSALRRTVNLTVAGDPIQNLRVTRNDLVGADQGVILSDEYTVEPIEVTEVSDEVTFTITIPGSTPIGTYSGLLTFTFDDQPSGTPLELMLEVTVFGTPQVSAEVNSQDLTIFASQPITDVPFWGSPYGDADGKPRGEIVVFLQQNGESATAIEEIEILSMRTSGGRSLPADVVRIESPPTEIKGKDAVGIEVVYSGQNIAPGSYSGILVARIKNQSTLVTVPIKLDVKHGWVWPLLVLVIGTGVALLFGWWNGQGKKLWDLARKIEKTATEINEGSPKGSIHLQGEERRALLEKLKRALKDIEDLKPQADIQTVVDEVDGEIQAKRADCVELISTIDGKITEERGHTPGKTIQDRIIGDLEKIKEKATQGKYDTLEQAKTEFNTASENVGMHAKLVSQFNQLPAEKQQELNDQLDKEPSAVEFYKIVQNALKAASLSFQPIRGLPFALGGVVEERTAWYKGFSLRPERKYLFLSVQTLVPLIAYLFVMVIGYITLYVNSTTFGATPMDYVTVFLWGATVESVRGQTGVFTFAGLQARVEEIQ